MNRTQKELDVEYDFVFINDLTQEDIPSKNHTNAKAAQSRHTTQALASVWLSVCNARHCA